MGGGNPSLPSFRDLFFSLSKKPCHLPALKNIGCKVNHQSEETHLAQACPSRSVSKPSPDAEGAFSDSAGVGTKSASESPQFPGALHAPGQGQVPEQYSETRMNMAAREYIQKMGKAMSSPNFGG